MNNNDNDDSIIWNVDVDRNMTRFNKKRRRTSMRFNFQNLDIMDSWVIVTLLVIAVENLECIITHQGMILDT